MSATPAMIADASDLRWHNLFVKDEWGRIQYHEIVIPEIKDDNGRVIHPSFTKSEPILNPEWDSSQEYIHYLTPNLIFRLIKDQPSHNLQQLV